MSTKIYTGFRFRSPSWKDAQARIAEFRAEVCRAYYAINCRRVSVAVCRAIDEAAIGGGPPPDRPFVDALSDLTSEQRKEAPSFELVLFPHGRLIYGMAFGDWPHCEAWLDKPHVERWPYWNNTDRPEDVTAREWRRRQKTWDAILGGNGYGTPAEWGFIAQCLPKYPELPRPRDVVPLIPSLDERALAHANNAIIASRYGATRESKPDNYHRAVESARAFLATDEGKAVQVVEVERIRPLLPPEITAEMMVGERRTVSA